MGLLSNFKRKLPVDTQQIEQAILHLEQVSSAELRVVVERKAKKTDTALERAEQLFNELKMYETAERNAVLIYLSFKPHYLAVVGDVGIHAKVGEDFWIGVYESMKQQCKQADYTAAICAGIEQVSQQLAHYFPIKPNDVDELENEVVIK